MSIVKSLVEAHGGRVQAHSEGKGRGAAFSLSIPLAERLAGNARANQPEATSSTSEGEGLRIFVVDDNTDAAELLCEALRTLGHTTRTAFDGPRALEVAAGFRPHVVLLDLGLPVMDGFELASALRELPGAGRVALVAVTGYGQESDRRRTRDAGFDEHLVKPIDLVQLERWLRRRGQEVSSDTLI